MRFPSRLRARGMKVRSTLPRWPAWRVREALRGLPIAHGYTVVVKPLRYRKRPSLRGLCIFDDRLIEIQVPEPFYAFDTPIYHRARRLPGRRMRFRWFSRRVTFRTRREVIRFLYLHEYLHWYLWEVMGRKAAAETACERYALANFRKRTRVVPPSEFRIVSRPREVRKAARGRRP